MEVTVSTHLIVASVVHNSKNPSTFLPKGEETVNLLSGVNIMKIDVTIATLLHRLGMNLWITSIQTSTKELTC